MDRNCGARLPRLEHGWRPFLCQHDFRRQRQFYWYHHLRGSPSPRRRLRIHALVLIARIHLSLAGDQPPTSLGPRDFHSTKTQFPPRAPQTLSVWVLIGLSARSPASHTKNTRPPFAQGPRRYCLVEPFLLG